MDSHKNAPMTPAGRLRAVHAVAGGEPLSAVAKRSGVDRKTLRKWVRRFGEAGEVGLVDRSSRPHRSPRAMAKGTAQRIVVLRRRRRTTEQISREVGVSRASVARVLKRAGLNRLSALEPAPLPKRYEWARPGDMLHIDTKKLARIERVGHRITGDPRDSVDGAGWQYAFVGVDDNSRSGLEQMFSGETRREAVRFLEYAVARCAQLGMTVRRVMTENAKIFHSRAFEEACRGLKVKHIFTKPYTPRTNGKAERFIQTAMRECFYGRVYRHSRERIAYFEDWLHYYTWHRPHASLGGRPPVSRLPITGDNLLRLHN